MKKVFLALFAVAAIALLVVPAHATELWDPHMRALNEGLAAGALPPPGVYFIDSSYFTPSYHGYGNMFGAPSGKQNRNFKLFSFVEAPVLLWVPGCKFLGGDYAMAIAQPFDYTNLRVQISPGVYSSGAQWGMYNTILVPYQLSWRLPCDFHIMTGLGIALNDPTSSPATAGTLGPGSFAPSGVGTYTFDPTLGISWLHAGWNLSVDFHYAFQTKDSGTDYQSGQQIGVDYTATYTWRKWTFGVGVAEINQTTTDSQYGINIPDSKANVWAAGPIFGYNFGPCSLQFIYNFPIYTNNDVGGAVFFTRLVVPLWK